MAEKSIRPHGVRDMSDVVISKPVVLFSDNNYHTKLAKAQIEMACNRSVYLYRYFRNDAVCLVGGSVTEVYTINAAGVTPNDPVTFGSIMAIAFSATSSWVGFLNDMAEQTA